MSERHILSLSGGKDSAALAVYMREEYPHIPLEYLFIDSGCELPETYAYLDRLEAILGIDIIRIGATERSDRKDFFYWLKFFNGVLPSPQNRWCTRLLKIQPYVEFLKKNHGSETIFNYAGLRADEDRTGYKPKSEKVFSRFPFVEDGLILEDVKRILASSGIGLPEYYSWRQRSGCFFCFFQKDSEWCGLKKHHPDLFEKACLIEENHSDGRTYTWRDSGSLRDLDLKRSYPAVPKKEKHSPSLVELLCFANMDRGDASDE